MFASSRFCWPLCALALLGAGALHGCGNAECLRDSDCGSHLECRAGACEKPPPTKASPRSGEGGADAGETPDASAPDAAKPDASLPDASMPDAAMPDASMPDAGVAGAAGAAGAAGMSS